MTIDVVGVGTAVVDYLAVMPAFPQPDSQMEIGSLSRQGGGNVSTTLATLARLGASTCFLGKLGDDELARLALSSLRDLGVDVSKVVTEAGASAGFAFILVDERSGARTILWSNENKPQLGRDELDTTTLLDARILHLDEYEMAAAIAAATLVRERAPDTRVVLDAESGLAGIDTLLPLASIVIASRDLAVARAGCAERDLAGAARSLFGELPAEVVVVTDGARGSFCVSAEDSFAQPAFAVQPVDTTGCGDVYRGGFSFGLLRGWSLRECARFASATAALACLALGGRAGIPAFADVQAFMAAAEPTPEMTAPR